MSVWALPVPLAATPGITIVFFSSGYLDVSVHRVPLRNLFIQSRIHGVSPCGFPHSEIRGSQDICSSPRLFAAYHVFHRLSVPRHPPCALSCLTFSLHSVAASLFASCVLFYLIASAIFFWSVNLSRLTDTSDVFSLFLWIFSIRFSRYVLHKMNVCNGLKWTRTTDLTLIRRAL